MEPNHPYRRFERTKVWRALSRGLEDLQSNGDIRAETSSAYIVGYLSKVVYEELKKNVYNSSPANSGAKTFHPSDGIAQKYREPPGQPKKVGKVKKVKALDA